LARLAWFRLSIDYAYESNLGLSIKDGGGGGGGGVRGERGGGGGGGGLQMRTSVVFGAKNVGFFVVCPHGQGERGSIFRDFVRTSFMDGLFLTELTHCNSMVFSLNDPTQPANEMPTVNTDIAINKAAGSIGNELANEKLSKEPCKK